MEQKKQMKDMPNKMSIVISVSLCLCGYFMVMADALGTITA